MCLTSFHCSLVPLHGSRTSWPSDPLTFHHPSPLVRLNLQPLLIFSCVASARAPPMSQDLQTTVISACAKHEEQNSQNADYRACVYIGTDYFVKYGTLRDLKPELATQEYIFTHAQQTKTPDAPRIAQILHHFVDQRTMYLVMEYIMLQESPPDLTTRIQKAMKWLSDVPPPPNYALGPVRRGRIRHQFFKDFKAPFVFPDIVTLDQYAKTVRPCLYFLECPPPLTCTLGQAYRLLSKKAQQMVPPVSICGERVMFT